MTLRIPRAVLYVLLAGVVIGIGVAAYLILREPAKDCLTTSGEAVTCDTPDSLSQAEYDQMKQEEAAAAKAAAALAECRKQTDGLMKKLQELDSRLSVGLTYQEFSTQVGNARVAYDQVPTGRLALDCLTGVAVHLEDAMNSYAKSESLWSNCIDDFSCDTDSIEPDLQAKWADATGAITKAKSGLSDLGKPAQGEDLESVTTSTTATSTTSSSESDSECVNASSGEPMDCDDPGAVDRDVYEESPASDG